MNWQPIDTAPLDGTLLLLFDLENNEFGVGFYAGVGSFGTIWNLATFDVVRSSWDSDPYSISATHWMALPEPPKK